MSAEETAAQLAFAKPFEESSWDVESFPDFHTDSWKDRSRGFSGHRDLPLLRGRWP
jgi:hypothetical protein